MSRPDRPPGRPRIGITCELELRTTPGRPRFELPVAYADAVERAGGVPLLLPGPASASAARRLMATLDGVIFSGGNDLDPSRYGEPLHPKTRCVPPRKEESDRRILAAALARRLPVLGICYGCQLLSVARGGRLIQDLPSQRPGALPHRSARRGARPSHPVRVEAGSRLHRILGRSRLTTNSSHHQAIRSPGRGLRAVAWSPDGVIEAVEDPRRAFVIGVQWHPERMPGSPPQERLFRALVRAAAVRPGLQTSASGAARRARRKTTARRPRTERGRNRG